MTRLVRNRVVLLLLLAWAAYWPVTLLMKKGMLFEAVNGLLAASSIGIVVSFFPGVWKAYRDRGRKLTGGNILVLGVVVVQAAMAMLFVWSWAYRFFDEPEWMVDHIFRGWLVYLMFLGGLLHLMAGDIGDHHNHLPAQGYIHIGIMVAIGLGMSVLLGLFVSF